MGEKKKNIACSSVVRTFDAQVYKYGNESEERGSEEWRVLRSFKKPFAPCDNSLVSHANFSREGG